MVTEAVRAGVAVVLVVLGLGGCGAGGPHAHLAPLLEGEQAERARELAPDLVAAAELARDRARRAHEAGDDAAAADHATRSRLLLDAAFAETERIELARKRRAIEAKAREAEEAAVRDEQARARIHREVERELAAGVARGQADRAFDAAAEVETRRARARGAQAERTHREAARVIVGRARLVLASARALGAAEERVGELRDQLDAIDARDDPTAALSEADDTLGKARALLGEARKAPGGPTADEVATLVAEAKDAGLEPMRLERGLALRAGLVDARGRADDDLVEAAATLLQAHPHGPVHIEVGTAGGRAARRRAERRGRVLLRALIAAGASEDRLDVTPIEDDPPALLLPAY